MPVRRRAHRDRLDQRPPQRHARREERDVLERVQRAGARRPRRTSPGCARGTSGPSQMTIPVQRVASGPSARSTRLEPAGGGSHDHARQRRAAAAAARCRPAARAGACGPRTGSPRPARRSATPAPRAARVSRRRTPAPGAARRRGRRPRAAPAEAPDVDPDHQRDRRHHGWIGEPLDVRVPHCHGIVAIGRPHVTPAPASWCRCWFRRSAGAAVAWRGGGSRCVPAAAACCGGSGRTRCRSAACRSGRPWPTPAPRATWCAR